MVTTSGGGVDVIFYGKSTVGLVVMTGSFWGGEGITYGESDRIFVDSNSRSFIIYISDIDSDISLSRESRGVVVCNFDTESDGLVFLVV